MFQGQSSNVLTSSKIRKAIQLQQHWTNSCEL
jgi:hypothetical protein